MQLTDTADSVTAQVHVANVVLAIVLRIFEPGAGEVRNPAHPFQAKCGIFPGALIQVPGFKRRTGGDQSGAVAQPDQNVRAGMFARCGSSSKQADKLPSLESPRRFESVSIRLSCLPD